jgi:acetylornithine deacetylase/succinyl-diaminopimelate desuccinylase-like protein
MSVESILEHLRFLSVEIGPRVSTSANERRAAEYIERVFRRDGLEVAVEDFSSIGSFAQIFYVVIILQIVAAIVFLWSVLVAFVLSLVCLLFLLTELNLKSTVSRVLPRRSSQNVVGRLSPSGNPEKRVVLMGHCDSAFPFLFNHPRMAKFSSLPFLVGLVSSVMLIVLYGLAAIFQAVGQSSLVKGLWYASFPFLGYLGVVLLVFAFGQITERGSNGANDNASGVSVILGVASELSKNPLVKTEVWCVATGCEETGTTGTIRFLDRHARELEDAYLFSVDCVGKGSLRYIVQEGVLSTVRAPSELVGLVDGVARRISSEVDVKPVAIRFHASDAYPLLQRGLKAMDIISLVENDMPANLHWKTDVYENIDSRTVSDAFRFVLEILRAIDSR